MILDYIKENGSISNVETCRILELKPTRVKEILRGMVNDGVLSVVGEKKQRRYVIKK